MTNHLLLANLISRIILATVGILLCWVPFRLLSRNGEFAGAVLIIDVSLMNLFTIINSIIWHTDDVKTWWDGSGLCDLEVYLWSPLQTIYAAAIFTIMFHLAQQVKVGRRSRRRNLVILQAAFIFPIPVFQLAFTYFDLAQRYIVGTGIGCSAVYDSSWPTMVVYDVPPALFALLSVPYAVLLWIRYRALTKQTQGILNSTTPSSIRTRRRLYNMSLSILTVYLPVMMYLFVLSVKDALASYKPYNFHRMRYQASPYPWSSILFVPSSIIPSSVMNQPWIPIATTVVITTFFGTTTEARAMYSRYADALGLWKRGERFGGGTGTGTLHSQRILLASNQRRGSLPQRDETPPPPLPPLPITHFPPTTATSSTSSDEETTRNKFQIDTKPVPMALGPPIIPPRQSSLRPWTTFFRTSINRVMTLPTSLTTSLRRRSREEEGSSSVSMGSDINIRTFDSRTDSEGASIPMGTLTAPAPARDVFSQTRPVSRLEMRPLQVHGGRARRAVGGGFPREQTLSSLATSEGSDSGVHGW